MVDKLPGHNVRDPQTLTAKLEVQLDQAAAEVSRRFGDRIDYDTARRAVGEAYAELADKAKFSNFLPILAARSAHEKLHGSPQEGTAA